MSCSQCRITCIWHKSKCFLLNIWDSVMSCKTQRRITKRSEYLYMNSPLAIVWRFSENIFRWKFGTIARQQWSVERALFGRKLPSCLYIIDYHWLHRLLYKFYTITNANLIYPLVKISFSIYHARPYLPIHCHISRHIVIHFMVYEPMSEMTEL